VSEVSKEVFICADLRNLREPVSQFYENDKEMSDDPLPFDALAKNARLLRVNNARRARENRRQTSLAE